MDRRMVKVIIQEVGKGEIPVDVPENFTLHELMAKIKSEKQIITSEKSLLYGFFYLGFGKLYADADLLKHRIQEFTELKFEILTREQFDKKKQEMPVPPQPDVAALAPPSEIIQDSSAKIEMKLIIFDPNGQEISELKILQTPNTMLSSTIDQINEKLSSEQRLKPVSYSIWYGNIRLDCFDQIKKRKSLKELNITQNCSIEIRIEELELILEFRTVLNTTTELNCRFDPKTTIQELRTKICQMKNYNPEVNEIELKVGDVQLQGKGKDGRTLKELGIKYRTRITVIERYVGG